MTKPNAKPTKEEYEKLGKAVEGALINDYINWLGNTRRQAISSFIRGIFMGLGTAIGATLVVALLVWILYILGDIPGIGEYFKGAGDQIENKVPGQ